MAFDIFTTLIAPINLLIMNLGLAVGIIIGALPGLTPVLAITVLLPLTFGMEPITGMFLLLGAYCGGIYGGSITAILINTPGTPAAAATLFDGYELTKKGRAGDALKTALVVSTIGGLFSCIVLMFVAPQLARVALKFGPPEYFAITLFGMTIVVSISGKEMLKGLIMACLGLLISTVGIDSTEGVARLTFGLRQLYSGLAPVTVMLGTFAVCEVLNKSLAGVNCAAADEAITKATITWREILKYWKTILKSSVIGTFIGAVPGTGAAISAFFAYNEAKRTSKHPETFGKGELEGVVAPETANNACTGGTLIPLLTLGVPGDVITAVMMGALVMQGITPGPELFVNQKFWVYSIMAGLAAVNIFMYVQGTFFIKGFAKVTRVPFTVMVPILMVLCTIGAFAVSNKRFDIYIMLAFGLIGYILSRFNFPMPPMTIALVLGPLVESNLRRSLVMSAGDVGIFFTRPISLVFIIIIVLSLAYPPVRNAIQAKLKKKPE